MKHHYSYKERLRKQTYSQSGKIDKGIIVHEALESALKAYHNTGYTINLDDIYRIIDDKVDQYAESNRPEPVGFETEDGLVVSDNSAILAEWDETVSTARQIAKRTIKYLDVPANWRTEEITWNGETVPLIEFRFEYPLVEDRNIAGKFDWVARNIKDGFTYLIDWKTRAKFTGDFEIAGEDMNLQLSIYQYVLSSMGIETSGTITYQIRSSIPSVPEKTKNGHISKAKITTDYDTYMAALVENQEELSDYLEVLERIQDDEYWWLPLTIYRDKLELASRWDTVQKITRLMIATTDPIKFESPRCAFCPFFRLCLGEDRGIDPRILKESAYVVSDNHK